MQVEHIDFMKLPDVGVTNRDTATGHVTGPYVYNSIVSLCSSLV